MFWGRPNDDLIHMRMEVTHSSMDSSAFRYEDRQVVLSGSLVVNFKTFVYLKVVNSFMLVMPVHGFQNTFACALNRPRNSSEQY